MITSPDSAFAIIAARIKDQSRIPVLSICKGAAVSDVSGAKGAEGSAGMIILLEASAAVTSTR